MSGILVIRGGAIGDFILTLPSLRLLRESFPDTRLEILGYKHIVSLAEGRYYADATRSIEYAGLASFFIPGGTLPDDLIDYFAGFGQVISYLYDPDGFFETNLRRAGVKNLISAYAKIDESAHASRQLARPLERLALYLGNDTADQQALIHPRPEDRRFAETFLSSFRTPVVALHPGSGGRHKLWELEGWQSVIAAIQSLPGRPGLVLIGGEADAERLGALAESAEAAGAKMAWNLPLPHLAAVLERCSAFAGHDSGISHLAAAVGTPSLVLFGATNPAVWAPAGEHVRTLVAPEGDLARLDTGAVIEAFSDCWARRGIRPAP